MKAVKLGLCCFFSRKKAQKAQKMIRISIAQLLPLATNAYSPMTNAFSYQKGWKDAKS